MSSSKNLSKKKRHKRPQRPIRKTRIQHKFIMAFQGLIRNLRSRRDRVRFGFRDHFELSVKVLSLTGIFISCVSLAGGFKSPLVVRWLFFIWSIITTGASFSKGFVAQRAVIIDGVNRGHSDFVDKLAKAQNADYKVIYNDSRKDAGLYYKNIFPDILLGLIEIEREAFSIPDIVEKYADKIIKNLDTNVVNEKKVRLCTDLHKAGVNAPIRLQRTCYFDDRVTNNLSKSRLRSGEETILGHRFMIDRDRERLVELEHAANLSNQLGGSTLLLTGDRILVISEQGRGSQENASRFASTGSGSFDWLQLARLKKEHDVLTFSEFAISEIERELTEEVAFDAELKHKTFLVGYGRYLYRNGKPELFGLTVTEQSSRTLHVRHQEWDFHEKILDVDSRVETLTSSSVLDALKALMDRMILLSIGSDRTSVPLLMNIETSIDYLQAKLAGGCDVIADFYNA